MRRLGLDTRPAYPVAPQTSRPDSSGIISYWSGLLDRRSAFLGSIFLVNPFSAVGSFSLLELAGAAGLIERPPRFRWQTTPDLTGICPDSPRSACATCMPFTVFTI